MDLSGDTQIWAIGLIGFQRACRGRETDTRADYCRDAREEVPDMERARGMSGAKRK